MRVSKRQRREEGAAHLDLVTGNASPGQLHSALEHMQNACLLWLGGGGGAQCDQLTENFCCDAPRLHEPPQLILLPSGTRRVFHHIHTEFPCSCSLGKVHGGGGKMQKPKGFSQRLEGMKAFSLNVARGNLFEIC